MNKTDEELSVRERIYLHRKDTGTVKYQAPRERTSLTTASTQMLT